MLFDVLINNDNIMEEDEEFILIINIDSLPSGIVIGSDNTTIIIIRRNDGNLMIFIVIPVVYCDKILQL